jgi:hypothetical protein
MRTGRREGHAIAWLLCLHLAVAAVLCSGCGERTSASDPAPSAVRNVQLKKAEIKKEDIESAIELEKAVEANSDKLAPAGMPWFVVIKGSSPVIVTAAHATKPMRDGELRFSDGAGTAALATLLNKKTGCTVIYTQYASPSDPNYYDDNDFKKELLTLIESVKPRVVLDLHGSHPYRPYDVDIGTMNGESLLGRPEFQRGLVECLREEGILNFSSNLFSAANNATIAKFCKGKGVPAMQLEISSTWVSPSRDDLSAHRFAQLSQGLCRYIRWLSQ